jgi:hypothetical protein
MQLDHGDAAARWLQRCSCARCTPCNDCLCWQDVCRAGSLPRCTPGIRLAWLRKGGQGRNQHAERQVPQHARVLRQDWCELLGHAAVHCCRAVLWLLADWCCIRYRRLRSVHDHHRDLHCWSLLSVLTIFWCDMGSGSFIAWPGSCSHLQDTAAVVPWNTIC